MQKYTYIFVIQNLYKFSDIQKDDQWRHQKSNRKGQEYRTKALKEFFHRQKHWSEAKLQSIEDKIFKARLRKLS